MEKIQAVRADTARALLKVENALRIIAKSGSQCAFKFGALERLLIVRRTIDDLSILLAEPNHVSAAATPEIKDFIQILMDRVAKIMATLKMTS